MKLYEVQVTNKPFTAYLVLAQDPEDATDLATQLDHTANLGNVATSNFPHSGRGYVVAIVRNTKSNLPEATRVYKNMVSR